MASLSKDLYVDLPGKNYPAAPYCLICDFRLQTISYNSDIEFGHFFYRGPGPTFDPEVLESSEFYMVKTWWNTGRMLLYEPGNGMCCISGVRFHDDRSKRIPLNENEGYAGWDMATPSETMVEPKILSPRTTPKELVGYHIHSRCWELLLHHELGTVAESDINILRLALRKKYMQTGYRARCWNPDLHREDPVRTKCVSDAISLALEQERRRKAKMKRKKRKRQPTHRNTHQARSCNLPMEILYMIFSYVPSKTVAVVEKELGLRLGNKYWRSRISNTLFYEIGHIADDEVDWKRLCMKLERRLETSTALVIRRYLLECMDDIMEIARELIDD